MTRLIAAAVAILALSVPAVAGPCSEEIKALQGKAKGSDAASKPGNQATNTPGASSTEGGGEKSASAKVLEAQAHDGRGDEQKCMKAIEEAKREIK